ncbi:GH25 family lysozyme [Pseudarthrobacter sp. L19]|uniref:GH25 family lysozyme n=1 Tax=Pseudarthrobacter sp. L19 TaxID=3423951 RepID=UPI003D799DDF
MLRSDFLSTIGPNGASMGDGVRKHEGKSTAPGVASADGSAAATWMPPGVQGLDVSNYQAGVDWGAEVGKGAKFAYVKASEGNYYLNPAFKSQFNNSFNAGLVRGSYHFAIPHPDAGTAADQARYFVANGGVWSGTG